MIRDRDFLVLADDWHGPPSSTVHLFRQLAPHNRVFWMKVISRMPQFSWRDARRVGATLGRWASEAGWSAKSRKSRNSDASNKERADQRATDLVETSRAVMIPWFHSPIQRFNQASLHRQWGRIRRRFGVQEPVMLTTMPPAVDFLRTAEAAQKIYFCLDEWSHYPGLDHRAFARMEQQLLASVDGYAATSHKLMEKGADCPARLYLPQGVDFEHFHSATRANVSVEAMEKIRRPIIGFFGLIAEWVDVRAILAASKRFPEVSFVLIGDAQVDVEPLARRPNIYLLGPTPYKELPGYARFFDIGVIPFVSDQLTEAVNPLKLLEYFALGLPVVATGLPELAKMDGPVWVADDIDGFCQQLDRLLERPAACAEVAIEVARRNTWQERAESFSEFLEALS